MIVLRIKEYSNGEIALEYRMKIKERSMVDVISYHYLKLGTFVDGGGIMIGSANPTDIDANNDSVNYDLIKTLSEVGEKQIADFTIEIELAVNHDDSLETWIESIARLFCLFPENMVIVNPGF